MEFSFSYSFPVRFPFFHQIFEEEHNVWFLDKGGALVAVKQPSVPTRHLWWALRRNLQKLVQQFPAAIFSLIHCVYHSEIWVCLHYI